MQILYGRWAVIYAQIIRPKRRSFVFICHAHYLQWQDGAVVSAHGYNLREPGSSPDDNFTFLDIKIHLELGCGFG